MGVSNMAKSGNGAREKLIEFMGKQFTDVPHKEIKREVDRLLARLYIEGYVVTPLPYRAPLNRGNHRS